jgi:uncharacterized protein YjiK
VGQTAAEATLTAFLALAACSRPTPPISGAVCESGSPAEELELVRALPVEGDLEPSGLALAAGKLLLVADKHDDAVFELALGAEAATPRVFVNLASLGAGPLDLEGIAADEDGSWLLVSEAHCRVLRATANGATSWVTPSLESRGQAAGLFAKPGAGLEGVARRGRTLLLAAEREPRGFLQSEGEGDGDDWHVQVMPGSRCPARSPRPNDWADLSVWQGRVFALARNSHLVVEMRLQAGAWQETNAWSYARTENDPRFVYEDRRFGLGEGLAVDDEHVYVALDNNRTARLAAPNDRRPLLFVFRRPGSRP